MNRKIFIYGAPGAGKTTFSAYLKTKLSYPLVEADYLREVVAQAEKTKEEDPFVYVGTKEAWRNFGELNEENVIKGLLAVRKSMSTYVARELAMYPDNLILEGTFLDPVLGKDGQMTLVISKNEARHKEQYFQHRSKDADNIETLKAVRLIQEYLIDEAKNYSVSIIENSGSMDDLLDQYARVIGV